eukprot:390947-Pyramimonas_sp.AAC.1
MRNNLDPLAEHSDGDIWEAVQRCRLGDRLRRHLAGNPAAKGGGGGGPGSGPGSPAGGASGGRGGGVWLGAANSPADAAAETRAVLESSVADGGDNFSIGERQDSAGSRALRWERDRTGADRRGRSAAQSVRPVSYTHLTLPTILLV